MTWYKVSEETLKVIQLYFPEWSANLVKGTLAWGKQKKDNAEILFGLHILVFHYCSNCQCQKFSLKCFCFKKLGHNSFLKIFCQTTTIRRNYTESTSLYFIKWRVIFLHFLSPSGDLGLVWSEITYLIHPATFSYECWNLFKTELN